MSKRAAKQNKSKQAPAPESDETKSQGSSLSPRTALSESGDPASPNWVVVDEKDKADDSPLPPANSMSKTEVTESSDLSQYGETITEDGELRKKVIKEGTGSNPAVMSRVYVFIKGSLLDGTVFLESPEEEFDFQVGRGEVSKGLQMAMTGMRVGETAVIYCGKTYGYNEGRRPPTVPEGAPLLFEVTLRRWESEKSLHEMSMEDKIEYLKQRREIGKTLFAEGRFISAQKQYQKALELIGLGLSEQTQSEDSGLQSTVKELWLVHLLNSALCKLKMKDYEQVISLCTKALELDRQNVKAFARRGEAHHRFQEYDEAVQDYKRVLELTDDDELKARVKEELKSASELARQHAKKRMASFSKMFSEEIYDDKPMPTSTIAAKASSAMDRFVRNPCRRLLSTVRSWCGSRKSHRS